MHWRFKPRCAITSPLLRLTSTADRFFVLTASELLWYERSEDFHKQAAPTKRLELAQLIGVAQHPASRKWPACYLLLCPGNADKAKWEMNWPSVEEAEPWVTAAAELYAEPWVAAAVMPWLAAAVPAVCCC